MDHVVSAAEARLDGMRVVVDCANGAASAFAPAVLERLGAEVIAINAEPNGSNINVECGALYPEVVAEAVVANGAHAGVAHDGDADRALFADADGNVIDGDQVLAACAISMKQDGQLTGDTVVATVMSNIGFHRAMREHAIRVISAPVGDRYVLEQMLEHRRRARRRAVGSRDLPGPGHDGRRVDHGCALPFARRAARCAGRRPRGRMRGSRRCS